MRRNRQEWLSMTSAGIMFVGAIPVFGGGAFSQSGPLGNGNLDAGVGLSSGKTYTHAYNIAGGTGTTNINGVVFTNTTGANFTGVANSFGLAGWNASTAGGDMIGAGSALNNLLSTFIYNGATSTLTLSNLVAGQTYIMTFYQKAWSAANGRIQSASSAGGAATVFDEDVAGQPNANLLRYTFTATGSTEWMRFVAQSPATLHLYGFTVELLSLTNAWSGSANWSEAIWTAGVPNGQNAQAVFPSQDTPTAIHLDLPAKVGHLQFGGTNAVTVDGANALTVWTDVGGAGLFNVVTGSHVVAVSTVLSNDMVKLGGGTLTMSGVISGSRAVNVGAGSLVLSGTNTHSGGTVVNGGGTLVADNSAAVGSGPLSVNANGLLRLASPLSGSSLSGGGTIDLGTSALTVTQATATVFAGVISGGAGLALTKDGSGTLQLTGTNTYSGATTVKAGTLAVGGAGRLGSGSYADAITDNGAFVYGSSLNQLLSGNISGSGSLTQSGAGTLTLSGANSYSGGTVISAGTLALGTAAAAPVSGAVTVSGGTYDLGGINAVTNGTVTMSSGAISNGTLVGASYVFSGGAVYATLAGTGTLTNSTGTTTLYGTDTYSGGTVMNSGILAITNTAALPGWDTAGKYSVASGAALAFGNAVADGTVATLLGTGNFLTGANVGFDTSAGNRTCAFALTNAGTLGLVKLGANTLTLSPASLNGRLTVRQGTLTVASGTVSNNALDDMVGSLAGDSGALVLQGSSRYVKTPVSGTYSLFLGYASGSTGTLAIADSATFQTPSLTVGNSGVGAVYQTGGTNVQTVSSGIVCLMVGKISGGYGFYSLSGGIQSNAAQNLSIGYNGLGVYYQSGNSTQAGSIMYLARSTGGTGVLYVTDGTISRPGSQVNFGWETGVGRGEWTMAGGTGTVGTLTFGMNISTNTGILNLNGGLLQVNAIVQGLAAALGFVNFNGGTLRAGQNTTGLLTLKGSSGAYVFRGGAVIDDNGFNITVPQNLLAPAGSGVTGVTFSSPLSGYIGAPYVQISGGGGTGATAVALFNQTGGSVTGIVVTGYGVGYTSQPTLTLVGGGNTNRTLGTATLAANTGGGLTKLGSGRLILSGTNTYGGVTTISNGTLRLAQAGALPTNAAVVVAGGVYDLGGFTVTNGTVTIGGGTVGGGSLSAVSLNVSGTNASSTASLVGTARKVGNGTLALRGLQSGLSSVTVAEGTLRLADQNPAPIGAVACYRFDGTAADATGNGHSGTLEGSGVSYVAGRSASAGQAINFTGAGDVAVAYKPDLALTEYTVSAWVKLNAAPGTYGILGTRFGGDATFDLKIQSNKVHGDVGNGTGWLNTTADFNVVIPTADWHMITYAADGAASAIRMYYDGVLTNTLALSGPPLLMTATETMKIGLSSGAEYMNGSMDDVFIYGAALSSAQVAQLYQEGVTSTTGNLPVTASVTVADGAIFDLGGYAQTLSALGGSGLVTNGALTVTGTLAPGGTNSLGTLTLAMKPTVSGATLLVDVTSGGASDLLRAQGDLNLSGMTLQVADTGLLNKSRTYTIAEYAGTLTGPFSLTNLTKPWFVMYDSASHTVKISYSTGTLIRIM